MYGLCFGKIYVWGQHVQWTFHVYSHHGQKKCENALAVAIVVQLQHIATTTCSLSICSTCLARDRQELQWLSL
jgi:hypothetical protein